jgi:hypothetical protein
MKYSLFIALATGVTILLGTAFFLVYQTNKARNLEAQEMGCEYLGNARDLYSVAFYDCNGTIVLRRNK